jgi:23S rRNA-/tRNA-specific pseudouridylate synthase
LAGYVPESLAGREASVFCAELTGLPEAQARELVLFGAFWLAARPLLDPLAILRAGQAYRLNFPRYGPRRFYRADPSRIVYQDRDILVYDKESGRPVQGVPHDAHNNLLSALGILTGLELRLPHRIDAGTSGLVVLAKSREAASFMGRSFQEGRVIKRYLALSAGSPPAWEEKDIRAAIAKLGPRYVARANGPGLPALTRARVLAAVGPKILFLAKPFTGRTHQIRLHLSSEGFPVDGDPFYGGAEDRRLMLRASGLSFLLPCGRPLTLGGPFGEEFGDGPGQADMGR